jgi:hypothetical protein
VNGLLKLDDVLLVVDVSMMDFEETLLTYIYLWSAGSQHSIPQFHWSPLQHCEPRRCLCIVRLPLRSPIDPRLSSSSTGLRSVVHVRLVSKYVSRDCDGVLVSVNGDLMSERVFTRDISW